MRATFSNKYNTRCLRAAPRPVCSAIISCPLRSVVRYPLPPSTLRGCFAFGTLPDAVRFTCLDGIAMLFPRGLLNCLSYNPKEGQPERAYGITSARLRAQVRTAHGRHNSSRTAGAFRADGQPEPRRAMSARLHPLTAKHVRWRTA